MFDVIIIGAGPAGYTAGIYAARRQMKTLIIGKEPGGQVALATEIENYPGLKHVENYELITKWQDHVSSLGVEIKYNEVKKIEKKEEDYFVLYTENESFQTKTIIIAMGLVPRRLAIKGEEELTGRGVSYCANCDSHLFKNKKVAVVGGGNSALDAAELLSKISEQVYLIHRRDEFRGFEALIKEVEERKNIELVLNSEIKEIIGNEKVEGIEIFNNKDNSSKKIDIDGIFIEVGRIAHTDLVADFVERTEKNQLIVDDKCRTSTPGIFAAGDVTTTPYKQITIAAGQATIAALAAYEYLQLKQNRKLEAIVDRGKSIM